MVQFSENVNLLSFYLLIRLDVKWSSIIKCNSFSSDNQPKNCYICGRYDDGCESSFMTRCLFNQLKYYLGLTHALLLLCSLWDRG